MYDVLLRMYVRVYVSNGNRRTDGRTGRAGGEEGDGAARDGEGGTRPGRAGHGDVLQGGRRRQRPGRLPLHALHPRTSFFLLEWSISTRRIMIHACVDSSRLDRSLRHTDAVSVLVFSYLAGMYVDNKGVVYMPLLSETRVETGFLLPWK